MPTIKANSQQVDEAVEKVEKFAIWQSGVAIPGSEETIREHLRQAFIYSKRPNNHDFRDRLLEEISELEFLTGMDRHLIIYDLLDLSEEYCQRNNIYEKLHNE